MTTLIFATYDDASPLIHLVGAEDAAVRDLLGTLGGDILHGSVGLRYLVPGRVALGFLRAMSPDQVDAWQPDIESTPIFNVEGCAETAAAAPALNLIAWNPDTWEEWDLEEALDPDFAEVSVVVARQGVEDRYLAPVERAAEERQSILSPAERAAYERAEAELAASRTAAAKAERDEALFQEIVAICRPESPAIIEATTKALARALEAEEERLANPPGFV